MSKLISASIDVNKISKDRLYKGKKGTYLKLTFDLKDEADQYGNNVSIWEEQTEEERKSKANRNFLGNGKVVWSSGSEPVSSNVESEEDLLPF